MIGLRRKSSRSKSLKRLLTTDAPAHLQNLVRGVVNASEELHRLIEEPAEALEDVAGEAPELVQERSEHLRPAQVKLREELERVRQALSKEKDPEARRELEKVVDEVATATRGLLGPDWERLADGRTFRVQAGRDFNLSIPEFSRAAQHAAVLTGKRVLLVRDKKDPEKYTWVQFLDGEIQLGEPCTCGGNEFTRIRAHIVRCRACNSTFLAIPPPDPNAPRKGKKGKPAPPVPLDPESTLASFVEGRLRLVTSEVDTWQYQGYARTASGEEMSVTIRVPIVEGSPVPDSSSQLGWAHEIVEEGPVEDEVDPGPWDVVF